MMDTTAIIFMLFAKLTPPTLNIDYNDIIKTDINQCGVLCIIISKAMDKKRTKRLLRSFLGLTLKMELV